MACLVSLETSWTVTNMLAAALGIPEVAVEYGRYPDGESRFRLVDEEQDKTVLLLANLHDPDRHALPVFLLEDTLRDLGARAVHLVAPYLPYMRQDKRFRPGEGVTSRYFAAMVSRHFDSLVTIDPHLHRYNSLSELYIIPDKVLAAAPVLAQWIAREVHEPLLIGPDAESEQWVAQVAQLAGAPFVIGKKVRHGDRNVEVTLPDLTAWKTCSPVLVDDIISSGKTMTQAARKLAQMGMKPVTCVGVHAVFGEKDYATLADVAATVVTTDSIPHATNAMSVAPLLAEGCAGLITGEKPCCGA